jgi:hypothetical protein
VPHVLNVTRGTGESFLVSVVQLTHRSATRSERDPWHGRVFLSLSGAADPSQCLTDF